MRIGLLLLVFLAIHRFAWAADPVVPTATTTASAPAADTAPLFEDIVLNFSADDGTPLEAKLSLPLNRRGPVAVVFHLHGAGPRNFDHAIRYKAADGQRRTLRYYDYYARELTQRGIAFFRMSKRGCKSEQPSGRPIVDRPIFSQATPPVLLSDYSKGLAALRERSEIDPKQIILSGASEGTVLAPRLALKSPDGIIGLILKGYAEDNQHDIVVWQNTVGPWRNVQKLIPAAKDGVLTQADYDAAVQADPALASQLNFSAVDTDKNGEVNADEMARMVRPRLDAILKAVEDRNDELIWQAVVNLTSAYLLDGWEDPPHSQTLLKLDIPIAIFHGELDGACRAEGVHEAVAAFQAAGKKNLTARIYPDHDHDLNWTIATADSGGPEPFQDAFAFAASLVRRP